MYTEGFVNRGLPMTWMARVLAENPARIFGLYPRKGVIRVGADADLCIWDEAPAWAIERAQHLGIAGFTPYEGLAGARQAVDDTPARPVLLNSEGVLEQKPGFGQFLARTSPLPPIAGSVR
jgi:dihydropyrimidinase